MNYYSILLSLNSINHRPSHQGIAHPALQIYLLSPIKTCLQFEIWRDSSQSFLIYEMIFFRMYFSSRAPAFKYLAIHTRKNKHCIHTGLLNPFSGLHFINFSNLITVPTADNVFVSINFLTHCFDSFNVYFITSKRVLRKETELALF